MSIISPTAGHPKLTARCHSVCGAGDWAAEIKGVRGVIDYGQGGGRTGRSEYGSAEENAKAGAQRHDDFSFSMSRVEC